MRLNFCFGFDVAHGTNAIHTFFSARHGNVSALQVLQRDVVSHFVTQCRANLVQRELGCVHELVIAQAESGIKQLDHDRQNLGLLLGQHVQPGVSAKDVAQVGQRGL